MPVPSNWHPGEIAAQQARGFEDAVWGGWEGYHDGAPDWMMLFLSQLSFLSVTTIDRQGRPWSSLLHNDGNLGFIQPSKTENHFTLSIRAPFGLPIRDCLIDLHQRFLEGESALDQEGIPKLAFQMAGVGIMLHNRRRNKLESLIVAVHTIPQSDSDDKFVFEAQAISTFGNCPKYINTRHLHPIKSVGKISVRSSTHSGQDIPKEALDLIADADSLYLASRYSGNDPTSFSPDPPRLGNNHRGGPSGFLRTFWDEQYNRRCIVLPDWSGNRLMMSFGNMTKDPVAGIAIPFWSEDSQKGSSVVYATCSAKVLANEEAQDLMRGVRGAVKLWIEDWTLAKGIIPMYAKTSDEATNDIKKAQLANIGWSPYNPPVRLLKSEQNNTGYSLQAKSKEVRANMIDAHFWSESVGTFTFSVDDEQLVSNYKPGQHIVIDCYDAMDTRLTMYAHMAQFRGGEKDLNDDGTRSWTIAYACPSIKNEEDGSERKTWTFEIVLRRKNRGGVTPTLFRVGKYITEAKEEGMKPPSFRPQMNILGLDGSSFLPSRKSTSDDPLHLVYLLSGIGVTPVLSHLSALAKDSKSHAKILIVLATRKNEAGTMQSIIRNALLRELTDQQSFAKEVRLDIKMIILISNTTVEEEEKEPVNPEEGRKAWESMPEEVHVDVSQKQGERMTPNSFYHEGQGDLNDFILPPTDAAVYLKNVDFALICAAQKFTNVAQEALNRAGVPKDVQSIESFSF